MIRNENESTANIIRLGLNCWRVSHASRAALLIDGAAYFAAFRETVRRASHSVESCQSGSRTLKLLEPSLDPRLDGLIPDAAVIDPEKPIDPDELAAAFVPLEESPRALSRVTSVVLLLVAISALAAAWRWTSLREWVNTETLIYAGEWVRNAPAAPLWNHARVCRGFIAGLPNHVDDYCDRGGIR